MRSRLARMALSILVMLSVAAPASAWHVPDHALPSVTSAMPGALLTDLGAAHHDQAADELPNHEQSEHHGHDASSDVLGNSSCCDIGCHADPVLMVGDLLPSPPRATSPSAAFEFALGQGPGDLRRPG